MSPDFVPASRFDDAALAALFCAAYEGYFMPVHLDAASFRGMMDLQDADFDASRVALAGGAPVALAMLARRGADGWIGGMGVVPAARGRGLAARVMEAVLSEAARRGVARVWLEVLVQNERAIRVYERLGFRAMRRLEVLERPAASAPAARAAVGPPAARLDPAECLAHHAALHAAERLPWQRGLPVQRRLAASLEAYGVRDAHGPVAAVLVRPLAARAAILDVGLAARAPEGALASALHAALAAHAAEAASLLNLEPGHPACVPLRALGFEARHAQHEMCLTIGAARDDTP
uniref:GNAT family N-acetyltransferase n=1 Tax=Eiseniibacteriota bacterium TaxID=2212470 RepID=A0A832I7D7_UNCEI